VCCAIATFILVCAMISIASTSFLTDYTNRDAAQ
jgi:hypothetical protein